MVTFRNHLFLKVSFNGLRFLSLIKIRLARIFRISGESGLVNESKKTEQILLNRILKLEQTVLSLGRERSEIARECAESARRMRNLIFFGIDETIESNGGKRRVIEQQRKCMPSCILQFADNMVG